MPSSSPRLLIGPPGVGFCLIGHPNRRKLPNGPPPGSNWHRWNLHIFFNYRQLSDFKGALITATVKILETFALKKVFETVIEDLGGNKR